MNKEPLFFKDKTTKMFFSLKLKRENSFTKLWKLTIFIIKAKLTKFVTPPPKDSSRKSQNKAVCSTCCNLPKRYA